MALGPGSIAFTGYDADGTDNLAFVALSAISNGTVIFFRDDEWQGTAFNTGESSFSWTATADVAAGSIVTLSNIGSGTLTADTGSTAFVVSANRGLSGSDEIVYAYTGTDENTPTSFLSAVANLSLTSGAVLTNTGLTAGSNALQFGVGIDVAAFNGSRGDQADFASYASILNTAGNWITQDGSGDQDKDTVAPDVPFSTTAFTVGASEAQDVSIAAGSVTVSQPEGNAGTTVYSFTVQRTGGTTGDVTVNAEVTSAQAGSADFDGAPALPITLQGTIAAGSASTTLTVIVAADTAVESSEDFTLTLKSVSNSDGAITTKLGAQATATGTIIDDDSALKIGDVQGAGHTSSKVGQIVTLTGVVTAADTNGSRGFYIQDSGDGNAATSDGIFIFLPSGTLPTVGREVRVTGTVLEFTPNGAAPGTFSTTELTSVSNITDLGAGSTVTPTQIGGVGGLLPPTTDLTAGGLFYESLEGMLVTVKSAVAIGPTNRFGEVFTVVDSDNDASNGLNATGLTPRGNLLLTPGAGVYGDNNTTGGDYNPERIQIDDDSGMLSGFSTPSVNVGATLNDVTGIMRYDFGNYEVIATQAFSAAKASTLTKETTTLAGSATKLTVAAYNAENLDPNDSPTRFATIGAEIVNNLLSPDIIALQEIQDNNGATNDATIAANVTLQMMVSAIATAGGPTYAFVDNPFIGDDTNGGEPGGNIRTAYLYRTDRVGFVSGSLRSVAADGSAITSSYTDQQTNPDNPFFTSRPPLVATFTFNGAPVTVVNNHFTSKGGSAPLLGSDQPPLNNGEIQRSAQAQAVNTYVDGLLANNPYARVVVIGDLNEFPWEEPMQVLKGTATVTNYDVPATDPSAATATLTLGGTTILNDLGESLPADEQFDYVFDGNSETLDHVLVTKGLTTGAAFDVVRINAEFADQTSDHEPLVASLSVPAFTLSNYVRIGRYNLPEPTRTTAPSGSVLAQEVSAVTYDWDTDTLFVVGDGGTSIVQISKTGQLIDSMTLAAGSSPQGTEFYDPEGLAYIGGGKFVMTEERDRTAVQFTYKAGTTLGRADAKTVGLGTNVGNIGLEGMSYDPSTSGFIFVKEKTPLGVFQTTIDFAAGTASNGSPSTVNSTNLFDPSLLGLSDFADVFALSNLSAMSGLSTSSHLLVLSQEAGKVVETDRFGTVYSTLNIVSDPGNLLSIPDQQHEGMTMGADGLLYLVSENGGGDFDHPQLWVYAPSTVPNLAPASLALNNQTNALAENTSTAIRLKVADVVIGDDGLGINDLTVTGTDAAFFEVDLNGLYIKVGTKLDFETKSSFSVTVNVDDNSVGSTPDASATYTLSLSDVVNENPAQPILFISEIAPWSSGNSPVAADWFEITNAGATAIDIAGWKMDDSSGLFGSAAALNGVTSLGAGESAIFIETASAATVTQFIDTWFGGTAPAGLQIGTYSGGGVGLSTGGDAVNLFDSKGTAVAGVAFGASPTGTFRSFNNAAGLNNATITAQSAVGQNGAFIAAKDAAEIGSPGTAGKLFISEVAPWSSGNSPVGADWFEVTNTTGFDIGISGWKMDDSSGSPAAAVALNGITKIASGESVIFLESAAPETAVGKFLDTWFGGNAPAGLQIGTYTGSGVGLGTAGDAVHLYDKSNALRASVTFGVSPNSPFPTFDNAAGLNNATISTLSAVGVNAAFAASKDALEVGSPGEITPVNDAPIAVDDTLSAIKQGSGARTIGFTSLTGNDLAGPANESVQTLAVSAVANAVGGSVQIVGTDVIFTPTVGFSGTASFDYTLKDNGMSFGISDPRTDVGAVSFSVIPTYTLQILHFYGESGMLAVETAPIVGAMVDKFRSETANTITLAEGDSWIPGPWLVGGADPSLSAVPGIGATALARPDVAIMNALGVNASALGNHEFDLGSPVVSGAIAASGAWVGAQFPFITANLNFAGDNSLRGLADTTLGGTGSFAGKEASTIKGKIAPYTVVTINGEKIGIVGLTTPDLLTKTSPNGTVVKDDANPATDDIQEAAIYVQAAVDALIATGVNKIIGVDQLDTLSRNQALAPLVSGIDVYVAGGGHERIGDANDVPVAFNGHDANFVDTYPIAATGLDGAPVLIVTTDTEYSYLGRLQVEFDAAGVISTSALNDTINGAYAANEATLQSVYGSAQTAAQIVAGSTTGSAVKAIGDAINVVVTAKDGNKFGFSNVYLEGDRVFGRAQETNLGNVTADANAAKALAALGGGTMMVSMKNGGGLRASIGSIDEDGGKVANPIVAGAAGNISQLDVENALRFDNKLMVFNTTGQGLLNILNYAAGLSAGNGGFPQIGGVRYSYDTTQPAGQKVRNVALYDADDNFIATVVQNGAVVANAPASIPVVILNFTAQGGDGYPIKANGDNFRYLLADGTLSSAVDEALDFNAAANVPVNALGEQKAMEDYFETEFSTQATAYNKADTPASQDLRIQNLSVRSDAVFVSLNQTGTAGDDIFISAPLNDTFNGAGGSDTVVFNSTRAAATITRTGPGSWTVTTANGGTDTLTNVEVVKFTDSSLHTTSQTPYLVPSLSNVHFTSILSAGDVAGVKPDGTTPWRMVGVPDGLGAFDNGDGTITVLMNHEIGPAAGVVREHGQTGAFVSKLIIDKATLSVVSASDLDQAVFFWNSTTRAYELATVGNGRFCSADLPAVSAFYDAVSGLGTTDRIFMNGEEFGVDGKPMAHIVTGVDAGKAYELPRLGNASWENLLARPDSGTRTVVVGTDDTAGGQVYVYLGRKQASGNAIEKAGLTNGTLYGIKADFLNEASAGQSFSGSFTLVALPNATNRNGTDVQNDSVAAGVTGWLRPEDGAWDTVNPDRFYFVTTNGIAAPSRLWALDFVNPTDPRQGGTYTALLDGTEGQKMLDNITVSPDGTLILQEDVGNNARSSRTWHYDPKTDTLTQVAQHDVARFGDETTAATAPFTQNEEASGVIDVTSLLGSASQRAFLVDTQASYPIPGEIVEGGQLQLMLIDTAINGTAGDDTLNGTFIAETITGDNGSDIITGGGGADTIAGGAGDDVIGGGIGTDTAVFDGLLADATIIKTGANTWTVKTDDGGTDTLTDVETFAFDNARLSGPFSSLSIAATSASKTEGDSGVTPFTFTVTRDGDLSKATSAKWMVSPGEVNGAGGADFTRFGTLPRGVVQFAAGEATKVITINVGGDTLLEADETFVVTLSDPAANTGLGVREATGTILTDDTGTVDIAVVTPSLGEGSGSVRGAFMFGVTRGGNIGRTSAVTWTVSGSGAHPAEGADFLSGSLRTGKVTFNAGEATKTITVYTKGDSIVEPDEDFTVTLSNATNGMTIGTASASATIMNDDASLSITAASASMPEGTGGTTPFTFTVTRTGNLDQASSARWAVSGSGANPATASDFDPSLLPRGVVSFAAGETTQTVTVNVRADALVEADQGFTVTLRAPSAGTSIGTATATGLIENDDGLSLSTFAAADSLSFVPAAAISGLDAPNLEFIGAPALIDLGPDAATVVAALDASRGVEIVSGFDLGQDVLDIDLLGALPGALLASDTTIDGVRAISLYGSADPAHGVVLAGVSGSQTAADLLANHTRFVDGHAIIG